MNLSTRDSNRLVVFFMIAASCVHGATNLIPGVELRKPADKLEGRLIFLYCTNGWLRGRAQIYEVTLRTGALRQMAVAPSGDFFVAKEGETFCVRHGVVTGWGLFLTNAFVYSDRLRESREFVLEREPDQISFEGSRVFFGFARHPMLAGDIVTGSLERVVRELQEKLEIAWDEDGHYGGWKSVDDRWIFFTGDDAPFRGTRLVSSPWNRFDTQWQDPKENKVRTVKKFFPPLSGSYWLHQLSPCGRYALIRRTVPHGDGWDNTYHLVNVSDGDTRVLLRDTVCHDGRSWMSDIHWVPDALRLPNNFDQQR